MPTGSEEHDDGEMLAEREAEAEGPSPAEPAPPGLERCHRPIMWPWAPQRSATVWPGPCQRPGGLLQTPSLGRAPGLPGSICTGTSPPIVRRHRAV